MSDFARCLAFVLKWEGGDKVTRDPHDPGGTTKYGISQRAHPTLDIERLTAVQAAGIYETAYWKPAGADILPWPLNLCVFDCAVNQGISVARRLLSVSHVPATYLQMRWDRYRVTRGYARYGRGWGNRLRDLATVGAIPWAPSDSE